MKTLKVGKDYNMEITSLTHEGLGVGRIDGIAVFVYNALVGEETVITITEVKKSFCFGKVKQIIKKSPDRVKPVCSLYGRCGGCNFMHLAYESQLEAKLEIFKQILKRLGKLDCVKVEEVIPASKIYNYRNKVVIFFKEVKGDIIYGFYRRETNQIERMEKCFLFNEKIYSILKKIKEFMLKDLEKNFITSVSFRNNDKDEFIVGLNVSRKKSHFLKTLTAELVEKHKSIISIVVCEEEKNKYNTLFGKGRIKENILGFNYNISIDDFFQTNKEQTEKLYSKVLEYAGNNLGVVVDGYCGVGSMTLPLSKVSKKVYGIEINETSVNDAIRNKEMNNVNNVHFILGKTEEKIKEISEEIDLIVIDPPRKGCDASLLNSIISKKIEKIIYVSCNPATLARDLRVLSDEGYEIKEISLFDMFPNTTHVECVVLMSKVQK